MTEAVASGTPVADPSVRDCIDQLPVPYIELDSDGLITRANAQAREVFRVDQAEIVGRRAWDLMAGDEIQRSQQAFFALMRSGEEPVKIRRSICCSGGQFRTFDLLRSLIRDPTGRPIGVRLAAIDVTEAMVAQEEAHRARVWLESVLESLGAAAIITDALGVIRNVTRAAEDLTGWKSAELIGKVVEKALPILSYESADEVPFNHRSMLDRHTRGTATVLDRKQYQLRVEMTTSPIVDKESGYTAGVIRTLRAVAGARPQL